MLLIRSSYMPIRFSRNINSSLDPTYSQLNNFTGWFLYFRVVVVLVVGSSRAITSAYFCHTQFQNFKKLSTRHFEIARHFVLAILWISKSWDVYHYIKGNPINHSKWEGHTVEKWFQNIWFLSGHYWILTCKKALASKYLLTYGFTLYHVNK